MEYHKGKVQLTKGLKYFKGSVKDTYLNVYLGRSSTNTPVYEYGHRIVAWSMLGPPMDGEEVLHNCDNPKCLSPYHIKYGSHRENMGGPS